MSSETKYATEAIEIVTFRLVRGASFAQFVAANRDVDVWLMQQPGFKSRRIAEQAGRHVIDLLLWHSAAAARAAMPKLMHDLVDSPVHGMIDQESVSWTVAEVAHTNGQCT